MKSNLLFTTTVLLLAMLASSVSKAQCIPTGGSQSGNHGGDGLPSGANGGGKQWTIPVVFSRDPNDITGLKGYQNQQWLSVNDRLKYTIRFENDPKFATAPAQNVFVYLPVDAKVNINSVSLGSFGFGRYNFEVPENQTFYSTRLDVRDSLGLFVDLIAGIDITQNRLFWSFKSIDPATGQPPQNALAGFLPVNDTAKAGSTDTASGKGEGYVRFVIRPEANLPTGDSVKVKATIIFDTNEEIETNYWVNAIDALPPVSQITSYAVVKDSIRLRWSGQDDVAGTGIREYALYVSENGSSFSLYQPGISDTAATFVGTPGNTYSFMTLATDQVGNQEPLKTTSNISIFIPNDKIVTANACPLSNTSFAIPLLTSSNYQWQVDMGTGYQNLSNTSVYEGVTTNTLLLKVPPTGWYGYQYRCVITNRNGTFYSAVNTLKFSMSWKGTQSTAWEEATNWSCNKIPDENTDVIINTTTPVKVNSNTAVRSITLYPGSNLTVLASKTLELKGKK